MPVALLTLPAVSPTGFSIRSLWAVADFSDCSSRLTVRVSLLPHSDLLKFRDDVTPDFSVCIFALNFEHISDRTKISTVLHEIRYYVKSTYSLKLFLL